MIGIKQAEQAGAKAGGVQKCAIVTAGAFGFIEFYATRAEVDLLIADGKRGENVLAVKVGDELVWVNDPLRVEVGDIEAVGLAS